MKRTMVAILFLVAFVVGVSAQAQAQTFTQPTGDENKGEGYGMHTGASTGFQAASFTINQKGTTCQVGTVNANGAVGPFEMSMVSVLDQVYTVDGVQKTITADGRMRSITRVGGQVVEDIIHPFVAVAKDNAPGVPQPNTSDTFEIHFITPFWHVGNPLCQPSSRIEGGCTFGGPIFLGDVNVK